MAIKLSTALLYFFIGVPVMTIFFGAIISAFIKSITMSWVLGAILALGIFFFIVYTHLKDE